MKLTIYQITYKGKPKDYIIVANESIPMVFLKYYTDINQSVIETFKVDCNMTPLLKNICQDHKQAILNSNHSNNVICSFTRLVIGQSVNWLQISCENWNKLIDGVHEYISHRDLILEIDHPINLEDKKLKEIIKEGMKEKKRRDKEIQERLGKIRKNS